MEDTNNTGGENGTGRSNKKRQTKRDCAEVVEPTASYDIVVKEKTKKLRSDDNDLKKQSTKAHSSCAVQKEEEIDGVQENNHNKETMTTITEHTPEETEEMVVWDLESALNYLVTNEQNEVERLSQDYTVSFRVGHAGDASTLAHWYRQRQKNNTCSSAHNQKDDQEKVEGNERDSETPGNKARVGEKNKNKNVEKNSNGANDKEQNHTKENKKHSPAPAPAVATMPLAENESASPLELWLANGLGDEQMPPSVYALLSYVKKSDDSAQSTTQQASKLAATALLTLAWEGNTRLLRVEWLQVDSELEVAEILERRMLLRLSALALMSACELFIADSSPAHCKRLRST